MSNNRGSDYLYKLIQSLTPPEKRYFKLYASRHVIGDKNKYQLFFDILDKMPEYDEDAVIAKLKNEKFSLRFSILKNRLYNIVLKSLDAFHANSSTDAELRRLLHFVEILYKRSLYDQSYKLLSSAKKLAYKYQKNTILIEILNWEKMLIEKDNYEGIDQKAIDAILTEDVRLAKLLAVYNEFWNVKSHLFYLLFRKGKARSAEEINQFKAIIDSTLLNRDEAELFAETKYLYFHIYSAYYFAISDYEQCYTYLVKNIDLIEKEYEQFKEEPNIYVSVLTNTIYVGMQLKKFEESIKYLKKLRNVPGKLVIDSNENLDMRLFNSAYSIELTLHAIRGDFEKGVAIIPKVVEGLNKYGPKMSSVRKASFYFSMAVLYIGAGDLSNALKWVNELLNNINIDESEDIHCFGQILNLIIHVELGNNMLLPYTLKSTSRYLETRNRVYKFESVILEFIANFLRIKEEDSKQEAYRQLIDDLRELKTDPFEETAFEYFDFMSWAESKFSGESFKEIVKQKALA